MQTILIIAAQSGAPRQPTFPPFGAGQPLLGAGGDGDGFTAILAGDGDPVRSLAEGAEVPPPALAAFQVAFPWPLPVAEAPKPADSSASASDSGLSLTGQDFLPQHGVSLEEVAASVTSRPALPVPAVEEPDRSQLIMGDAASALPQRVIGAVALQWSGASLDSLIDRAPVQHGLASGGEGPRRAAGPPVRLDTSPGMSGTEPNTRRAEASPSVIAGAGRTRQEARTVLAGTSPLPLDATADAAVRTASSSGSSGTDVHGMGQGTAPGLDGSLPDVTMPSFGLLGRNPLTAGGNTLKGSDATRQRIAEPDDGRMGRDLLATVGPLRIEETVQFAAFASVAESLWRGAALARFAGTGVTSDDAALMPVSTAHDAGLSTSPDRENDGVLPHEGRSPLLAGGPAGGPALQPPQAALWDARAVHAADPPFPVQAEALPDPEIALAAGLIGSTSSLSPLPAATPTAGTQVPATLAQLSGQIATALAQRPDGVTDIALSPDELGRVHITLKADAQNPDRMVVFLSFDRPETLDLFRRHADQLAEAIRTAGYAGADISFGQSGTGDGGNFGAGASDGDVVPENASEKAATLSANPVQDTPPGAADLRSSRPGLATALNLRL